MKEFEDKFSGLQEDIISLCMEYVEDRAEKIYIYASNEEGVISSNFFYLINNMYLENRKVNDALNAGDDRFDVSSKRRSRVSEIIDEDIDEIGDLCKKYDKNTPTEMKLIYDVKSDSFKAEYKYDSVLKHDDEKTANHIANEWFEEIKNNKL